MGWLQSLIARFMPAPAPVADEPPAPQGLRVRRFDAAQTNRLNEAHWSGATGQHINADLVADLETLRARCAYEISNNPLVAGVVATHACDIVGPDGPLLEVQSDDKSYNQAVEDLWAEWFLMPDQLGQLTGAEMLKLFCRLWWDKGEHLCQEVDGIDVPAGEPSLRYLAIDPDRLRTQPSSQGLANVALGVRRTERGIVTGYEIERPQNYGAYELSTGEFDEIPADEMIHGYQQIQPGQVRGIPILAPVLQVVADLRDFDASVLDAARLAASQGIVWWTANDSVDVWDCQPGETAEIERNMQTTGPPGWRPELIDPKQPSTNYTEFRMERLRELGRPVAMPLMKIMLGSEKHSFSSARMDGQNYSRAIESYQHMLEHGTVRRWLRSLLLEAALLQRRGEFRLPKAPARVRYRFTWAKQPSADPMKEASAERIRVLETRTLPFAEACRLHGLDPERVIDSWAETNRLLAAAGMPPLALPGTIDPPTDDADGSDNETGDNETSETEETVEA